MIIVCLAHDPAYAEMSKITRPSVIRYCQKQEYELYYDGEIDSKTGDACKIDIFRALFGTGQFTGDDWFFWLDTDALIMNSERRLEEYIWNGPMHVQYGCDFAGINTGAWFARFTSHADHFLKVCQAKSFAMGWADQEGIIQTYVQPLFKQWVAVVPGKGFNSMPYDLYGIDWAHANEINAYETGDLVLHLPGIEFNTRLELLKEYAKQAV